MLYMKNTQGIPMRTLQMIQPIDALIIVIAADIAELSLISACCIGHYCSNVKMSLSSASTRLDQFSISCVSVQAREAAKIKSRRARCLMMFINYNRLHQENKKLITTYILHMEEQILIMLQAYKRSQLMPPLFGNTYQSHSYRPLTYKDSIDLVPDYPSCALGVLKAQAEWGIKKGIAFVVHDNYLLACASNCYSHQHGCYPCVSFTIYSNRRQGYDTYKISKIFIPQTYKTLQAQRNTYNYALLYIQGEINMIDRYGSIGISFRRPRGIWAKDLEQVIISHDIQQLEEKKLFVPSGGPLVFHDYQRVRKSSAIGLVYFQQGSSKSFYIDFYEETYEKLEEWVSVRREYSLLIKIMDQCSICTLMQVGQKVRKQSRSKMYVFADATQRTGSLSFKEE